MFFIVFISILMHIEIKKIKKKRKNINKKDTPLEKQD